MHIKVEANAPKARPIVKPIAEAVKAELLFGKYTPYKPM
jgi:hypothetical protein